MYWSSWSLDFIICKMGVFENPVRKGIYMLLTQCLRPILLAQLTLTTFLFSELSLEKREECWIFPSFLFFWVSLRKKKSKCDCKAVKFGSAPPDDAFTLLYGKNREWMRAYCRCLRVLSCPSDASWLQIAFLEGVCRWITSRNDSHLLRELKGPEKAVKPPAEWCLVRDPWDSICPSFCICWGEWASPSNRPLGVSPFFEQWGNCSLERESNSKATHRVSDTGRTFNLRLLMPRSGMIAVPTLLGILKTSLSVFFPNCWSHPTTEGQELIPFSKFSLLEATSLPPRTSTSAGLPSVATSSPTNGTYSSYPGGLRVAPMLPVEWKASQLPSRQPLIFSLRPHTVF